MRDLSKKILLLGLTGGTCLSASFLALALANFQSARDLLQASVDPMGALFVVMATLLLSALIFSLFYALVSAVLGAATALVLRESIDGEGQAVPFSLLTSAVAYSELVLVIALTGLVSSLYWGDLGLLVLASSLVVAAAVVFVAGSVLACLTCVGVWLLPRSRAPISPPDA